MISQRTLLHYSKNYNAKNKQGWTALQYAARAGNNDILNILLDFGGKVNSRIKGPAVDYRFSGNTPLINAARFGKAKTVSVLLARGANVNMASASKNTALMEGARSGSLRIVAELLEHGADKNAKNDKNCTAECVVWHNSPRNAPRKRISNFIRNYRGY